MTQTPRSPAHNRRFGFRTLMLAPRLLLGSLLLGSLPIYGGCGWLSLIGHADGGSGSGGIGFDGGDGGWQGTGGAGGSGTIPRAHDPITSTSELDLLFVIDDSVSMAPLQAKLRARLADFMDVLQKIPGGLPSLHIGVVSSSLGAGIFGNVTGCLPGTIGNLNGAFQHPAACTSLNAGEHFIKSINGVNNYTGSISDVFACLTNIGAGGCGFEHPFEAIRLALQRAENPLDPDNAGFLRPGAFLGIVMLTNEDDCSVDPNSMLFDPNQQTLADPRGGLNSYRCNEFGHRCIGGGPPHQPPGSPLTLNNCTSAEDGVLVTVAGVVDYLKGVKADPSKVFVAALAGPATPYTVESHTFTLGTGAMEVQPWMAHSCTQATAAGMDPEYADPAVRVAELVRAFGPNGVFESICAADFGPMMTRVANSMVGNQLP